MKVLCPYWRESANRDGGRCSETLLAKQNGGEPSFGVCRQCPNFKGVEGEWRPPVPDANNPQKAFDCGNCGQEQRPVA
jgi:hypothetical protein